MTKLRYVLKLKAHQKPRTLSAVGWEVLEPSSAALQATATPSQLPAQTKNGDSSSFRPVTKKARCLLTPGLQRGFASKFLSGVRSDLDAWAGD